MKFFVETFGCQMNAADSNEMSLELTKKGWTPTENKEEADLLLLNTCTVRQHAEDKALSFIGRLKPWKKKKLDRKIIVTGCAAERIKKTLQKRFPHVDLVIGAKSIEQFPKILNSFIKDAEKNSKDFNWFEESKTFFGKGDLRSGGKPLVLGQEGDCAFVTIMRGCNYSCSYCIVPMVRGREIYLPKEKILNEVEDKVNEGAKEVMLLGQTVNSYWQKSEEGKIYDFGDLLLEVEKIKGLETIKFMSPHPHYMSDKLIQTLGKSEKFSSQIHLPVQSGSNKILKKMKRNYTREDYLAMAKKLKKEMPHLQLSTDFIVGFPGETDLDFKETISLAKEINFSLAYCFKYSPRAGTESFQMEDDVSQTIKEDRLSTILACCAV
ncbi:MAG: tRNA (N6-isopentenyl adenosine(37)-C2)-methylthiotransferase MiaB [Elusimicrobia bacterium RIFCSPLOWO2_02_FULL_39_32]|nr:MAG: tRNA (N6-isopentenyl adenosine(37)-C2)-methylthiotransferase MiaB [Elusimicrobia bacterium RIFCSPHIGHO2_02_FULL_39_36]OGR92240.1 MAG: tRNA (N6-isopentenyl adenosine(37)-C2)-methylthiotransferase MiaB [Elusimicrobia bacterium RIFCSPLOWO2_02_FULL_39_32]OGR99893.1 MAG: tRNA (N6-isopentenyl adenosine(37)-C2)-methylthiotransferase MiaB [Elusimicrobia bacterium RIFCSPLOWO2_12_FULL_39_28]